MHNELPSIFIIVLVQINLEFRD